MTPNESSAEAVLRPVYLSVSLFEQMMKKMRDARKMFLHPMVCRNPTQAIWGSVKIFVQSHKDELKCTQSFLSATLESVKEVWPEWANEFIDNHVQINSFDITASDIFFSKSRCEENQFEFEPIGPDKDDPNYLVLLMESLRSPLIHNRKLLAYHPHVLDDDIAVVSENPTHLLDALYSLLPAFEERIKTLPIEEQGGYPISCFRKFLHGCKEARDAFHRCKQVYQDTIPTQEQLQEMLAQQSKDESVGPTNFQSQDDPKIIRTQERHDAIHALLPELHEEILSLNQRICHLEKIIDYVAIGGADSF